MTLLVVLRIAYVFIVIEDKGVLEKELTQTPTITMVKTCKSDFDMTQISWWGLIRRVYQNESRIEKLTISETVYDRNETHANLPRLTRIICGRISTNMISAS